MFRYSQLGEVVCLTEHNASYDFYTGTAHCPRQYHTTYVCYFYQHGKADALVWRATLIQERYFENLVR